MPRSTTVQEAAGAGIGVRAPPTRRFLCDSKPRIRVYAAGNVGIGAPCGGYGCGLRAVSGADALIGMSIAAAATSG